MDRTWIKFGLIGIVRFDGIKIYKIVLSFHSFIFFSFPSYNRKIGL